MRKGLIASLVVLLFLGGIASAEEAVSLKTQRDKASYIIGREVGSSLKQESIDIDTELFFKGFKSALGGDKSVLSDDETREIMMAFKEEMTEKHEEELKKLSKKNKKEGEAFLAENNKKDGVVTLPSGLQYKVIKAGDGQTPKETDTVTVNYRGTFIDGTEFANTYKLGKPTTFPLKGALPGWQEALKLMKVGSKWQLVVPAGLAYGEKGAGNVIGPKATLIFDVDLLSIEGPGDVKEGEEAMPKGHGHH